MSKVLAEQINEQTNDKVSNLLYCLLLRYFQIFHSDILHNTVGFLCPVEMMPPTTVCFGLIKRVQNHSSFPDVCTFSLSFVPQGKEASQWSQSVYME